MNGNIDFFKAECQTDNITARHFGICDAQDGSKAFVDYDNEDIWIAKVDNRSGQPLNFTAIDNCIEIKRADGNMDNRCDAMLTGAGYIIFIELKIQDKNWITHAVEEQLQTTIDHFKATHTLEGYRKKFAYACNRRHPYFQSSEMTRMNNFRRKNGVRLCIASEIVIK